MLHQFNLCIVNNKSFNFYRNYSVALLGNWDARIWYQTIWLRSNYCCKKGHNICNSKHQPFKFTLRLLWNGGRVGLVVRALAFQFPHSVSYVDCVCWSSTLPWEVFPHVLRFSPLIKNQHLVWFDLIWLWNNSCKIVVLAMFIWFPLEL